MEIDNAEIDNARARLVENHEPKLQELFGSDYATNPRFNDAVRAVAGGRSASLVLADYGPIPIPYASNGPGW